MNQPAILLVGRALISSLFLVAGTRKAMFFAGTAGYFTKLGFPSGETFAVLAILIEVGAGLALLIGWKTKWAAWLLALFTVVATFMAHRFWEFPADAMANQLNHFLKNFAIIGGLAYVASFGPGQLALNKS